MVTLEEAIATLRRCGVLELKLAYTPSRPYDVQQMQAQPSQTEPAPSATPAQVEEFRRRMKEYEDAMEFAHTEGLPDPPVMP